MALAEFAARGDESFLKLSSKDDAPLKGGRVGESVFLCTRTDGDWTIHAEARLAGEAFRGPTPEAVAPIYGLTGDRHWWRSLTDFRPLNPPLSPAELGLDDSFLPRSGQAHVVRVGRARGAPSAHRSSEVDVIDRTDSGQEDRIGSDIRTVGESSEDVIIDEQGRIFRLSGERIARPGHAPEIILRSLAAEAAGKWVSLDEVRARRS